MLAGGLVAGVIPNYFALGTKASAAFRSMIFFILSIACTAHSYCVIELSILLTVEG